MSADTTNLSYKSYFKEFIDFSELYYDNDFRKVESWQICAFVAYLHHFKKNSVSTLRSKLSALSYVFKTVWNYNPTKGNNVENMLRGYSKCGPPQLSRLPINSKILHKLLIAVEDKREKIYKHAFHILYFAMYGLGLRISEVCDYSLLFKHAIQFENLVLENNILSAKLMSSKHSSKPTTFQIKVDDKFCMHFKAYTEIRGNKPGNFFVHLNGKPFNRTFVANQLKSDIKKIGLDEKQFNCHSFRIGRATDMGIEGFSSSQISLLGRWQSNAYLRYLKPTTIKV